jgi:hypothetical protein
MRDKVRVLVDGIEVLPAVDEFELIWPDSRVSDDFLEGSGLLPPGMLEALPGTDPRPGEGPEAPSRPREVSCVISYGMKGKPRQVSIVWRLFPVESAEEGEKLRAGLTAFGDFREVLFTPGEPEFLWRTLEPPKSRKPLAAGQRDRARLPVPVLSVALFAAAAVTAGAVPSVRRSRRNVALALGAGLVLALAFSGVAGAHLPLPWKASLELPEEDEAKELFESLLRNVYRSFDYSAEEDIYDTLAQSVAGGLLDTVYTEVFKSLVLREQGGAVCKIQSVKILDAEIEHDDGHEEAGFDVRGHWSVKGAVTHWGHTHFRTNEYRAVYSVRVRDGAWKFTRVQVIEHERTDVNPVDRSATEAKQ